MMKNKKPLRRFLALLLTVALVAGLTPAGAVAAAAPAEDTAPQAQGSYIAKGLSDADAAREIQRLLEETQFTLNTDALQEALDDELLEVEADTGASLVPQDPEDTLTVAVSTVDIPVDGSATVTVNRLKGEDAQYTVSVDWQFLAPGQNFSGDDSELIEGTLVFAPGDTSQTLTVPLPEHALTNPWSGKRPFFLRLFNCDRTTIDQPLIRFNLVAGDSFEDWVQEPLEAHLMNSPDTYYHGETLPIIVHYNNPVHITAESTLTLQGKNNGSPVTLVPANAGSTDTNVYYLHTLTNADYDSTSDNLNAIILSAGPVTDIYESTASLDTDGGLDVSTGAYSGFFHLGLRAVYGAVTPDKAQYQSGETVTITIELLNSDLIEYKGMVEAGNEKGYPPSDFKLSLDGGATFVGEDHLFYNATTNCVVASYAATHNADYDADTYHPEVFEKLWDDTHIARFGSQASYTVAGNMDDFVPVAGITVTGLESQGLTLVPTGGAEDWPITVTVAPGAAAPKSASIQSYSWSSSQPGVAVVREGKLMAGMPGDVTLTLTSDEVAYRQANGLEVPDNTGLVQHFNVKVYNAAALPTISFMEPALYIDYDKISSYFGSAAPSSGRLRWAARIISNMTGSAPDNRYYIRLLDVTDPVNQVQVWRDWFEGSTKHASYVFPQDKNKYGDGWTVGIDDWKYSETDPDTGELLPAYRIVVDNSINPSTMGGPVEASADVYIRPPRVGAACYGMSYYQAGSTISRTVSFGGLRNTGNGQPTATVQVYKDEVALNAHAYTYADLVNDEIVIELPNAEAGNYRIEWTAHNADDEERKDVGSSAFRVIDTNLNYIYLEDSAGGEALQNGNTHEIKAGIEETHTSRQILERYAELEPVRRVSSSVLHSQDSFTLQAPDGTSVWMSKYGYGGWMDNWMSVPADGQTYVLTCTENTFKKSISVSLMAESLKDKLYLFDMRSAGLADNTTYTLKYTRGNNEPVDRQIEAYNHQVAVYEPLGIMGDVTVSVAVGEDFYTGLVAQGRLLSGESYTDMRLGSKSAGYPINAVTMRSADRIVLTLNDTGGNPLAGKAVTVSVTMVDDTFEKLPGLETKTTTQLTTTARGVIPAPLPAGALQKSRGLGGDWMFCVEISVPGYKTRVEFLRLQVMRTSVTMKQDGHKTPGLGGALVEGHIEDIFLGDAAGFTKIKPGASDVYTYAASASPQLYVLADTHYTSASFYDGIGGYYNAEVKALDYAPGYTLYTFPYGLKDVMAADSPPRTFYFVAGGLSPRIAALSATLSAEEKLKLEEANLAKTLGDGMTMSPNVGSLTEMEGTSFSDTLKGAFHNLDFELPLSPLPISFTVAKRDNVFEVTGMVSIQLPPIDTGLTAGQEAAAEYGNAGSALLQEITNNILNQSTGMKDWTVQMSQRQSATFFSGIRGYITAIATYDRDSGQVSLQLTDGGFIMEASISSNEFWHPTPIPFVNVGFVASASAKNITSFTAADVSRIPKSDLVSGRPLLDMGFGTIIEVTLTVMGGLGGNTGLLLEGFVGVVGKGTAGMHMQTTYRHYLREGYPQTANTRFRNQGGSRLYLNGELSFDGWVGIGGKRIGFSKPIWEDSVSSYSPDNYINPLHPNGVPPFASGARLTLYDAPLAPEDAGPLAENELANGLDAMASPKYNDDGSVLAYVKNGQVCYQRAGIETQADPQQEAVAGTLDLAGATNLSVLAWEAYKSAPDIEKIDQSDEEQMSAFLANAFAPSEVHVGVSTGDGFTVKTLSNNSIADLKPQVAANADSAMVVWKQGTMTYAAQQENQSAASGFEGRMVFSRYSGDWSAQTTLMELGEGTQVLAYDVALEPDGSALVVLELERGNGAEILCVLVDPQGKVSQIESGLQGAAPQVAAVTVGGQQRFLVGYRAESQALADGATTTDFSFVALTAEGKMDQDIEFSAALGQAATGFSFLKGANRALEALGIAWQTSDVVVGDDGADPNSTLHVARFAPSGAGYTLVGGTQFPTQAGYAPAFDAYRSNNDVVAATLRTDGAGEAGVIQGATLSVANKINVGAPLYNGEIAAPGATLPVSFKVTNAGVLKITSLSFDLDGQTQTFNAANLLPGATAEFTVDSFTLPQTAQETDILVEATYEDDSTAQHTAKVSMAAPDISVTLLSVEDEGAGTKSAVVSIANQSLFDLSDSATVTVGLYTDALGTQPVQGSTPVTLTAADIASVNDGGVATASFALPLGADTFVAATVKNDMNPANNTAFVQGEALLVTDVTVSPETLVLPNPGATGTLTATVLPKNATNQNVTWTSANPAIATVDAFGAVTAVSKGVTVITATTKDGGKTASCTVTVNEPDTPPPQVIAVTGVTLAPPTAALAVGESLQLTPTVSPADATNPNVAWTSDSPAAAVDAAGRVTALQAGVATITVTTADGGKTATCTVTVTEPPPQPPQDIPVSSVELNMQSKVLKKGKTVQLAATVSPADATDQAVTWKSSSPKVASVSAGGRVKALKNGTAKITATVGGKTATATIRVSAKYVPVSKIKLSQKKLVLNEKGSISLKAAISPAKASYKKVVWASSDPAVATVSSKGKVTAKAEGKVTITATSHEGGKVAKCTVTVKPAVSKLLMNKKSASLAVGGGVQLKAAIMPKAAAGATLAWSSSKPQVASVSAKGRVKALAPGSATITVKAGNKKASCKITVK